MNASPLSAVVDRTLAWLKWPSAVFSLALLPASLIALVELGWRILKAPLPILAFALGAAAYFLLWWRLFRRSRLTFLLTLEHELTHALFAMATFHRVTGLRVTATRGGRTTYVGRGNWLVAVAPYFFPTLSFLLMAVFTAIPFAPLGLDGLLLGASLAYHLTSALRETHSGQSDLKQTGWLFCAAFLPTANIAAAGTVLAFAHAGLTGSLGFLFGIWRGSLGLAL